MSRVSGILPLVKKAPIKSREAWLPGEKAEKDSIGPIARQTGQVCLVCSLRALSISARSFRITLVFQLTPEVRILLTALLLLISLLEVGYFFSLVFVEIEAFSVEVQVKDRMAIVFEHLVLADHPEVPIRVDNLSTVVEVDLELAVRALQGLDHLLPVLLDLGLDGRLFLGGRGLQIVFKSLNQSLVIPGQPAQGLPVKGKAIRARGWSDFG